jgi:hypothetical protein
LATSDDPVAIKLLMLIFLYILTADTHRFMTP